MTIEDDDISAQQRRNRGKGDVTQTVGDPRVTSAINWVWTTLGAGVIAAVVYVGSQLGGLRDAVADTNLQVALSRQQANAILEELKDHEGRIRSNEGDLRDVKTRMGMNTRGPEVPRGH